MGRKLRLQVYKPRRRMRVSGDEAVPLLFRVGGLFLTLGGFVSFILSGAVVGVKSFFDVKQRVDRRMRGRYVELRIKKSN